MPQYSQEIYQKLYKMYSGNRGEKKYMEKIQKPSKVLLVCVYDTVVLNITNQIVRAKFQQFGNITNILIFEKGEVTKLFVEFSEVSQASKAKNKLDGTKLCQNICKMTIYFSNFSNVEVTNQSDQTNILDQFSFNNYETKTQRKRDDNYNQNQIKAGSNKQIFLDDEYIMESFNPFTTMKRSKTDNPYMLKTQINVINQNNFNLMGGFQNYGNSLVNDGWLSKAEDDAAIKMKQNTEVQSSILWFSYKYSLKPKFIYNVFSNFGNISSVTIKKQNVYIKFRTKQFAAMAFTYLNNTILMGNVMVLRQCPEDSNIWRPNQGQFSQSIFYNLSFDRFTPQRSITINPPANTIHISSIKRQVCRQKSLREIFSKYSDIDRIKILQNSAEKSMALIRFSTLEDSFNAMANLHNESFSGRKMQISFTKSKL